MSETPTQSETPETDKLHHQWLREYPHNPVTRYIAALSHARQLESALTAERAARQALEVAWQQMREERQAFSDEAVAERAARLAAERERDEAIRISGRKDHWEAYESQKRVSERLSAELGALIEQFDAATWYTPQGLWSTFPLAERVRMAIGVSHESEDEDAAALKVIELERALAERNEYWQQKCETAWQRGDEQGQQVVKLCLENADLERALAEARRDAERLKAENAGLERATTLLSERLAVAAALAGERDAG